VIPDPGFKVTVVLKASISKATHFTDTVNIYDAIGHHRHAIDRQAIATCIQLTNPLVLRKTCKLFASVARVCQRQLGFLVYNYIAVLVRDLRIFEIRFEFESAVPIRFDSKLMGRFELLVEFNN